MDLSKIPAWAFLWGRNPEAPQPQVVEPAPQPAPKKKAAGRGPASELPPEYEALLDSLDTQPGVAVNPALKPKSEKISVTQHLGGYLNPNMGLEQAMREEYGQRANQAVKEQQEGLDELNKYISSVEEKPREINYAPLAAFVDSMVPNSKLTPVAMAMAPMGADEKQKMLFDLKNKLQLGRQALSKEQLDALANQIKIQQDQYRNDIQLQHTMNLDAALNKRLDISRERLSTQKDQQTAGSLKDIVGDAQLKAYKPLIDGADRVIGQLASVRSGQMVDTAQFLADLNSEYVNLLNGSRNSALGKLERTEYDTMLSKLASTLQKVTGNPESIRSPEILKQIETGVLDLRHSYERNYNTRADLLKKEFRSNPDANRKQDLKIKEMKDAVKAQSVGPKPGDIVDGYRFKGGKASDSQSWEKVK